MPHNINYHVKNLKSTHISVLPNALDAHNYCTITKGVSEVACMKNFSMREARAAMGDYLKQSGRKGINFKIYTYL